MNINYIDIDTALKIINYFSKRKLYEILNEYKIDQRYFGRYKYFNEMEVIDLKKNIDTMYLNNKRHKKTKTEALQMGVKKSDIASYLTPVPLETIEKIKDFYNENKLYVLEDIEDILTDRLKFDEAMYLSEIQEVFNVETYTMAHRFLNYFHIEKAQFKYFRADCYSKQDVYFVKDYVEKTYKENCNAYYSADELIELGVNRGHFVKIKKKKLIFLEKVGKFSKCVYAYDKADAYEKLLNINSTQYYSTAQMLVKLKMSHFNAVKLAKSHNIKCVKGTKVYNLWPKEEIDKLSRKRNMLIKEYKDNYITVKEFEFLYKFKFYKVKNAYEKLNLHLRVEPMPLILYNAELGHQSTFITKKDVPNILRNTLKVYSINHLDQKELHNEALEINLKQNQSLDEQSINGAVPKTIISIEKFSKTYNLTIEELKADSGKANSICLNEIAKKYNIFMLNLLPIIEQYKIPTTIAGGKIITFRPTITELFTNLIDKQNQLLESYCVRSDLLKVMSGRTINSLKSINLSFELKFGVLKYTRTLYCKKETDHFLNKVLRKKIQLKYKSLLPLTTLPSEIFRNLLEELSGNFEDFRFCSKVIKTRTLWIEYVSKKLDFSEGSTETLYNKIVEYLNATEFLVRNIKDKEILDWSTNSINILLNGTLSKYLLHDLKKFLITISTKHPVRYNDEKLIDLYPLILSERKSRDTSAYDISTFKKLIEYVSNVNLHKSEILQEIEGKNKKNLKYAEYESVWLYIIVHLNNSWRNHDVIEKLPRISLPEHISTLESFKQYDLTLEEAESIVWNFKSRLFQIVHNKNKKQAYFFCSEKLVYPLANALILCELKCRLTRPLNPNLIKLTDEKKLNSTLNNKFFRSFEISNFTFKSLTANRSFITFVNKVLKVNTNRNPLEVTKYLRNHSSIRTTNIYVKISEEDLEEIQENLFDNGQFGYTYNYLLESIVRNENINSLEHKNNEINLIKQTFGDVYRIENLATFINNLNKNNEPLYSYLNKFSKEEKKNLLNLISLNNLPSKQENWQCIVGECIYHNRDCDSCPFAIPNMYSLVKNLSILEKLLDQYEQVTLEGEKVRIVNLIYRNLVILSAAKKKFGEKVIESFLGYQYSLFKKRISNLPDFYNTLTIERE